MDTQTVISPASATGTRQWNGPLFIVGMPRSGTKLLRGLLGQNSLVRIPAYETDFIPHIARWVKDHGEPRDADAFFAFYQSLEQAPYFVFRKRDAQPFDWKQWRAACAGRFDAAALFEGFVRLETGAGFADGVIWGDKSPKYIEHLPLLVELFPRARIVHLVRDVRDYSVSIRKAWGKDVRRAAARWNADVARAHDLCLEMPVRFHEVRYEDLLAEPERELRRLAKFIGVPFSPEMLQTARPVEHVGDAHGRRDIKRDNVGKFSVELTRREIEAVEALAWRGMRALGYAPTIATGPRHLSPLMLTLLRIKDGLALARSAARTRGLRGSLSFFTNHQRVSH